VGRVWAKGAERAGEANGASVAQLSSPTPDGYVRGLRQRMRRAAGGHPWKAWVVVFHHSGARADTLTLCALFPDKAVIRHFQVKLAAAPRCHPPRVPKFPAAGACGVWAAGFSPASLDPSASTDSCSAAASAMSSVRSTSASSTTCHGTDTGRERRYSHTVRSAEHGPAYARTLMGAGLGMG
jgi:hypothetical protein